MNNDEGYKKFLNFFSQMQELFPDCLLIVRAPEGGTMMRCSDPTWGLGAAERYINNVKNEDAMSLETSMLNEENLE